MQISESVAAEFVLTHLTDRSLTEYLAQDVFRDFAQLVRDGKEIAAAQQYQQVTGVGLPQAHFAVRVAQGFFA